MAKPATATELSYTDQLIDCGLPTQRKAKYGHDLQIPKPFHAGQAMTETEAGILNDVFASTVASAFGVKVYAETLAQTEAAMTATGGVFDPSAFRVPDMGSNEKTATYASEAETTVLASIFPMPEAKVVWPKKAGRTGAPILSDVEKDARLAATNWVNDACVIQEIFDKAQIKAQRKAFIASSEHMANFRAASEAKFARMRAVQTSLVLPVGQLPVIEAT